MRLLILCPVSFLLVVTEPSNCWKLPLIAPEESEEETQEMTASPRAVKETSVDVALVVADLSEVDGVFTIMRNKEWR